jgi:hypothetical protein
MKNRILTMIAAWLALMPGCSRRASDDAGLEKNFQQMMSGVTLVGHSTRANQYGISGEERYRIDNVSKVTGDTWLFQARVKYGSHDLPVPVPVAIKWAGDTPVITLTDLTIPGLGTFTARVLLYRGRYAGTWSAKDHGGEMFGAIVRESAGAVK